MSSSNIPEIYKQNNYNIKKM